MGGLRTTSMGWHGHEESMMDMEKNITAGGFCELDQLFRAANYEAVVFKEKCFHSWVIDNWNLWNLVLHFWWTSDGRPDSLLFFPLFLHWNLEILLQILAWKWDLWASNHLLLHEKLISVCTGVQIMYAVVSGSQLYSQRIFSNQRWCKKSHTLTKATMAV